MTTDLNPVHYGVREISGLIRHCAGNAQQFVQILLQERINHLSYSNVTSVEFCPYRYYLEFVQQIPLDPVPAYFVKGKAFHDAAALAYRQLRETGTIDPLAVAAAVQSPDAESQPPDAESQHHVLNAVTLMIENALSDWQVVAIEEPFMMRVSRALPPCVGIIDLVLRRDDDFLVVDHKTGRVFTGHDELQLVLYSEYIRRRYAPQSCMTMIDQYRWVNNLGRIRTPAFRREYVTLPETAWHDALQRMRTAYAVMQRITTNGPPARSGECFKCPFAGVCRQSFQA